LSGFEGSPASPAEIESWEERRGLRGGKRPLFPDLARSVLGGGEGGMTLLGCYREERSRPGWREAFDAIWDDARGRNGSMRQRRTALGEVDVNDDRSSSARSVNL